MNNETIGQLFFLVLLIVFGLTLFFGVPFYSGQEKTTKEKCKIAGYNPRVVGELQKELREVNAFCKTMKGELEERIIRFVLELEREKREKNYFSRLSEFAKDNNRIVWCGLQ